MESSAVTDAIEVERIFTRDSDYLSVVTFLPLSLTFGDREVDNDFNAYGSSIPRMSDVGRRLASTATGDDERKSATRGATMDEPADRRELSNAQPMKTSRWPRTSRRQERVRGVLERRQPDLTVVLENVHDPHNVSAVLRSCDAVGVLRVHLIYTFEQPPGGVFARTTSASAAKWIETERHGSIADCYTALRANGYAILATTLAEASIDLYTADLTKPTALVFGNEMRGVSPEAATLADALVAIPMMGMVESLNISVACAVTLYEALRQRRAAGQYAESKLDAMTLDALAGDWLRR